MDVSVAMATYNGERFILEQLESLAAQTLLPRELVVGDDGSTDRTLEIIDQFAARAPFHVRVQRNPTRYRIANNFLHSAQRCEGEWIAYCDQDDVWLPHKLERLAELIMPDPEIVWCAHRATIIDENSNVLGEHNEPLEDRLSILPPLRRVLWRTPFGFTQMFHRSLVRDFPIETRPKTEHDTWVFWLANVVGSTAFVPDRLALYRRHQSNVSQFTHDPDLTTQLADAAKHESYEAASRRVNDFSKYLSAQTGRLTDSVRQRVETGAKVYARLARHLEKRAVIWNPRHPFAARLGSWTRLAASGGYGATQSGGVGLKSGGKDLARLAWSVPGKARENGTAS
jgi:glycosyltransferase involved in cell wall biosynthesis